MEDDGRGGSEVLPRPAALLAAELECWGLRSSPDPLSCRAGIPWRCVAWQPAQHLGGTDHRVQ
ncbi:hypothetical protein AL527_02025 [Pseudomonas fulva]|nr:hypothetical protein AL527_02025 [Pseudomonas fulva]